MSGFRTEDFDELAQQPDMPSGLRFDANRIMVNGQEAPFSVPWAWSVDQWRNIDGVLVPLFIWAMQYHPGSYYRWGKDPRYDFNQLLVDTTRKYEEDLEAIEKSDADLFKSLKKENRNDTRKFLEAHSISRIIHEEAYIKRTQKFTDDMFQLQLKMVQFESEMRFPGLFEEVEERLEFLPALNLD